MRRFVRQLRNSYSDSANIFEELLLTHLDSFYAFALRLARNRQSAEDLVQEASLRAFKAFPQLRERNRFKNWIFRILRNVFLDGQSRYRHTTESLEDVPEIDLVQDGEKLLFEGVLHEEIRQAFDTLPLDYSTTLWLFDVEGFSQQEISEILDCPVGTVASRVYRARAMLRHTLMGSAPCRESQEGKS